MEVAINIFFVIAWVLYVAASVRYSVQMFQQNSYRTERYNRWLRSTGEWYSRSNVVALLSSVVYMFADHWMLLLCFGLWMMVIAVAEFSIEYKVKLVYTMRVRRLLITRLIITLLPIILVWLYAPRYTLSVAMIMALDYWTILANIINHPMEKAITRWYYNDAKRILRFCRR